MSPWRRCTPALEGMKTGASGEIVEVLPERGRPVVVWCEEPVREDGRDALRNW